MAAYAVLRIVGEQFREPDSDIGFWFGSITQGQLLSRHHVGRHGIPRVAAVFLATPHRIEVKLGIEIHPAMSTPVFAPADYLDLNQTDHAAIFHDVTNAWEVLPRLELYIQHQVVPANFGEIIGRGMIGEHVYIGRDTVIEPGAYIKGPAWIGSNCQIRHGAYIRENVIIGSGSIIGNSCEIKNSILFNKCQVPHFNYVGDSILGTKAHLAAGVIVSNLKLNGDFITLRVGDALVPTGLRKFGALIGDGVEVGCNAVINPGSILGRNSLIYPGVAWRGVLPRELDCKNRRSCTRADRIDLGVICDRRRRGLRTIRHHHHRH